MRSTISDAAQRAQTNASRATLREASDDHYWQEAKSVDVMASETHTDVERAQQYGFTAVPVKQDKDEQQQGQQQQQQDAGGGPGGNAGGKPEEGQQPKGDAAEAIVLYLNGSRSHPVIISVDDRRHRMMNMKEGDVALYDHRTQQLHFNASGAFLTGLDGKTVRMSLGGAGEKGKIEPPKNQQGGASSSGSSSSGQQQQKPKGQQPRYGVGQKSQKYVDVTPTQSRINNDRVFLMQDDGNGYVDVTGKNVWLGMERGKAKFSPVLTVDGPCDNVWGRLGGGGGGGGTGSAATLLTTEEMLAETGGAIPLSPGGGMKRYSGGPLPPPTPVETASTPLAIDSVTGNISLLYTDPLYVDSLGRLTSAAGAGGGIADAPNDGLMYGRQSMSWNRALAITNDVLDGGNF